MRKLIEKFYSYSPFKRVIVLILIIMSISIAVTSYSFYNLIQALNPVLATNNNEKTMHYETLQSLLDKASNPFLTDEIKNAVKAWPSLVKFSDDYVENFEPDGFIATHSEEIETQIIQAIKDFNGLAWHDLMIFSSTQLDPLAENWSISLRSIRNVSRLIARYQIFYKRKYPQENCSFFTSSILKVGRLTEVTWPFLIGKMVGIAVDGMAIKPFKEFLEAQEITQEEAKQIQKELQTSLCIETSFQKSLANEFSFFKDAKGKFFAKAPLALWILDFIYGDPDPQYEKLMTIVHTPEKLENFFKENRHPLLQIFVPNYRKAREQCFIKLALKSILLTELSQISGELKISIDPFTNEKLKAIDVDGKKQFYSVGPNLKDEMMQGDDVKLEVVKPHTI